MRRFLSILLLYIIPAALVGYGIWQNIFALIIGLSWIGSSLVLFEFTKENYEK